MNIVGIDVGKEGACSVLELNDEFQVVRAAMTVVPFDTNTGLVDVSKYMTWIAEHTFMKNNQETHVFIEQVHSFPRQGVVSTFTFGIRYGEVLALTNILNSAAEDHDVILGVHLVPASVWSKEITKAFISDKKLRKEENFKVAVTLYPALEKSLYRTSKCSTFHTGLVDALLVAEYGRRAVKGETTKSFEQELKGEPVTKILLENNKTVDMKWVILRVKKEASRIQAGVNKVRVETPKAKARLEIFKSKLKEIVKTLAAAEKAYAIAKTGVKYERRTKKIDTV